MSAEDPGLGRQFRKGVQRGQHLPGGSLEEAPAARAEERVAREQHAMPDQGDVPRGMAGHVEHDELEAEGGDARAIAAREPRALDRHPIARGTEHFRAGRRNQRRDAAHVVGVVMRREDRLELQSVGSEHREHRAGIARVHDRDRSGSSAPWIIQM